MSGNSTPLTGEESPPLGEGRGKKVKEINTYIHIYNTLSLLSLLTPPCVRTTDFLSSHVFARDRGERRKKSYRDKKLCHFGPHRSSPYMLAGAVEFNSWQRRRSQ